jgi:hypothetical protein
MCCIQAMTSATMASAANEYAGATFVSNEVDAPTSLRFDRWVRWRLVATDDAHASFHGFAVFQ